VLVWIGLAVAIAVTLLFVPAPYGRHVREGWGGYVPAVAGWVVMESVSLLLMGGLFLGSGRFSEGPAWVFAALWCGHYANRSWIYPLRSRMHGTHMPLSVMLMAVVFNSFNAGMNGYHLFFRAPTWESSWFADPRFIVGNCIFVLGMAINLDADARLRKLRAPGETGYKIPRGGLYRFVSCPNYLGEIIEWTGFAILTWSVTGGAFAIWTAANLAPRAIEHHRWYRERFDDYPKERKALIPFIV
jgi:protein-S-isoprenylcysteine O-methyltransferase Ste14